MLLVELLIDLFAHIGEQTMSDIAVWEDDRLVSYFGVMDDLVFAGYQERGIEGKDVMIISQQERDGDLLQCDGDHRFVSEGKIENWVLID